MHFINRQVKNTRWNALETFESRIGYSPPELIFLAEISLTKSTNKFT